MYTTTCNNQKKQVIYGRNLARVVVGWLVGAPKLNNWIAFALVFGLVWSLDVRLRGGSSVSNYWRDGSVGPTYSPLQVTDRWNGATRQDVLGSFAFLSVWDCGATSYLQPLPCLY
jgi:hypothetical protein